MPESLLSGNRVELFHDGDACLAAMLRAIEGATREVLVEMYWFGSDATGQGFAEALEERARAGLRVCITFDALGSFEADRAMFQRMRASGCDVYEYNPLRVFRRRFSFAGLNRRNHRKLIVVDGRLGLTGGVNFADPWSSQAAGGSGFRDDVIAVEGPVAVAMRAIMLHRFRGRLRAEALADPLTPAGPSGGVRARVLSNDRWRRRRVIERAYLQRIRHARERILITNSYFIPSRRMRYALAKAVRRGVRVRVLLPGQSDVPVAAYAARYLYGYLLRHGIELYEWSQSVLHSKTAVIDGDWCTVGTHNIDRRSSTYNLEINVVVEDREVAARLAARMQQDMEASPRVDAEAWRFRPLSVRLLEVFFYLFRRFL
jgi:cardiolipin synthase